MRYTRRRTLFAIAGPFRGPARRDDAGGTGGSTGSGSTEGGSGSTDGNTGGDGQADKDGQGDDTGSKKPEIKGDFDPERHARSLAAARDGEKKAKDAAKADRDRLAAVLKAAGLTPDGKEDPAEQLKAAAAERDKSNDKLRDKSLRLSVRENASKAGVDPVAIIDSSNFKESVKELDIDAADYDDQVVAAMKKAVKANPKLGATAAGPGKQGADHSGGGGTRTKSRDLNSAVAKKLGG